MIREQIKKDLRKAIEQSGILEGDFLDNIEWLLKTVNKNNFEEFPDPVPVGKLCSEVQKVLRAKNDLVYLKPRVYGKIRGWWRDLPGHPELGDIFYYLLPLALYFPTRVLADKKYANTSLLATEYEGAWLIVVEVVDKENWREMKTMFLIDSRRIDKEYETIWQAEKKAPLGGLADPSVLALRSNGVAGARFPGLQRSSALNANTLKKKCQADILEYAEAPAVGEIHLEHPANPQYGDYSSNVAMTIKSAKLKAQSAKQSFSSTVSADATTISSKIISKLKANNPQELAELIVKNFPKTDYLEKIEVAAPGFINFYLKDAWLQDQVGEILKAGGDYSLSSKLRVQVEFISANPTGPLTAGNARGGFAGDVLANVLSKVGHQVQREYYINDRGVQVEKLARSVKAYCDANKQSLTLNNVDIPEGGYPGGYVREIAEKMVGEGREDFKDFALSEIMKSIKKTIARMGIKFDNFFSEQSLYSTSEVEKTLKLLDDKGLTYQKDGAVWIKTAKFGDDKDRVLVKSDGEMTYIVSDIAYHRDKFEERKFDKVILFWGADHHGYVPRFLAMMEAIGHRGQAQVELIQLLKLARGGKEVRMSKRAGEYLTVDDVLDEIGLDAARFHFLMQPLSTPMTLDLEKAKEQSAKNPVYYVQYACARMHGILAKNQNSKLKTQNLSQILKLTHPTELVLIRKLVQLPEIVVDISQNHEVHRLPQYSLEVADAFHRFYENCQVLSDDAELTAARLNLVKATQLILAETLSLMGISAPERM